MITRSKIKQLEEKSYRLQNNTREGVKMRYVTHDGKPTDQHGTRLNAKEIIILHKKNKEILNRNDGRIIKLMTYVIPKNTTDVKQMA